MMPFETGPAAELACLLEASAPKPGNVHRAADFDDLTFQDLVVSAVCLGSIFSQARQLTVGELVRQSIELIAETVGRNTYLGTVILLAPLSKSRLWLVGNGWEVGSDVAETLNRLTPVDAADVYSAIRLAGPGGLGRSDRYDVADEPPASLLAGMASAADRDMVARQYHTAFSDVFRRVVPELGAGFDLDWPVSHTIVHAHVRLMASTPDSLIVRKLGTAMGRESQSRAQRVLDAGSPLSPNYVQALADLDFWLRSDGNRRNPGTTADLIAAGLFVLLRLGQVRFPMR